MTNSAHELYYKFRVLPTGLITIKGIQAYLNKERWPSQKIKDLRTIWLGYILSDGVILTLLGKMDLTMLIHHTIFTSTGLLSYKLWSGEDYSVIAENIPTSCVCESMGFLACLNIVTNRKFNKLINILHLLNIFLVRIPIWREIQTINIPKVKSSFIRPYFNALANAMYGLDLYWAFLIIRGFIVPKRSVLKQNA
jgi:hypothetical protein